jgi:hypothetical protein
MISLEPAVPSGKDNLISRAAASYAERAGVSPSWRFVLDKKIPVAAGLGGGALLLGIAAAWGLNQASKARAKSVENLAQANQNYINQIAAFTLAERQSREAWQSQHAPTLTQYVDVQTGAGAFSGSSANAAALAAAINNNGLNSAIGGCNFLRVARYSAPQPCGCDNCNE